MKNGRVIVLILAVISVALWCYSGSEAQQPAAPTAVKVGVVNILKVLSECQAKLDKDKQDQQKQEQLLSELKKLKAEADEIQQELQNVLKPNSQAFKDRREQWFNKQAHIQGFTDFHKEDYAAESQAWLETLYETVIEEVTEVARQKGISLMLNKDELPVKGVNADFVFARKVLYNAPSMDMTAVVLANIDLAYEKEKAAQQK